MSKKVRKVLRKRPTENLLTVFGTVLNVLVQSGVLDSTQRSYIDNWLGWIFQSVGPVAHFLSWAVDRWKKHPA